MTLSRGLHGATGGLLRAAAAGCVAATILAGIWAGPPALASSSGPQSGASAATAPAAVKYYIVPTPGKGGTETLYDIALRTLGNGSLYPEIFNLNKGRLEPDGARMENPRAIASGWILQLPADAHGPGVRFGPLPVVASATAPATVPASAPASHPASAPAAAAAHGGSLSIVDALGGMLLVILLAGLAVLAVRRPWRRSGPRSLHGREVTAQPGGSTPSALAARVAAKVSPRGGAAGGPARGPAADGSLSGPARSPSAEPGDWPPTAAHRPGRSGRPGGGRPDAFRSGPPAGPEAGRTTGRGLGRMTGRGAGRTTASRTGGQTGSGSGRSGSGNSRTGNGNGRTGGGNGRAGNGNGQIGNGTGRPVQSDPFGAEHPSFPGAGRLSPVGPDQLPVRGAGRSGGSGPGYPGPSGPGQAAGQGPRHPGSLSGGGTKQYPDPFSTGRTQEYPDPFSTGRTQGYKYPDPRDTGRSGNRGARGAGTLGPSPLVPGTFPASDPSADPATGPGRFAAGSEGAGYPAPSGPGYGALGPEHPSFPGAGHLGAVGAEQLSQFDSDPYGTMGPEHPSFPGAGHLGTVGPGQPSRRGGEQPHRARALSQTAGSPEWPPARHHGGAGGGQAEPALTPAPQPGRMQVPAPSGRHAARQVAERPVAERPVGERQVAERPPRGPAGG